MKKLILILAFLPCFLQAQTKSRIIFDTDIAPDYDDVGAMALLHAFADQGEIELLATISCNTFETTAATLSVLNTYFGRPQLPIGITSGNFPNKKCDQRWAEFINEKYPHTIRSSKDATDAVVLYRKLLASQPDGSVTIVSVGFFTNLANLLTSEPDEFSPLAGIDLVRKKVKQLVSMAARQDGHEFNVVVDTPASKRVFAEWPTPILLSGFEIGEKVLTGIRLTHNNAIQNSPVKDAFEVALRKDQNTKGRNSWDQTAVLVAVRGIEPFFTTRGINFRIEDDGKSTVIPGERFQYLEFKQAPEQIASFIEELMMYQPTKK
jgi:inosine-uridine nucleoside N-ribohydrolase